MKTIGNILWLIFGGLELAVGYLIAALLSFVLIVTIPFGFQALKLASYTLWPFGRDLVRVEGATGGSAIGNVVWVLIAGIWLAIGHIIAAGLLAITIIGLPLAMGHIKIAQAALTPFGKQVVSAA